MTRLVDRADVDAAAALLAGVAVRTPVEALPGAPAGDDGTALRLKREDRQPVGAFKLRGAYHAAVRVGALAPDRLAAGLVTHSSGNHGRAVAWTARRLGVAATVVAPDDAVEAKVEAMGALGARLVRVPADDREAAADAVVAETGGALIPPYDHRDVIAGQGTVGAEIAAQAPDVEQVLVPVGGGGLVSGIAAALVARGVRVVGVEPARAGDAAESLRTGTRVRWPRERVASTAADGLRAASLGALTWDHVRALVADVVTVEEDAIAGSARVLHAAGITAEASGAVATAGWLAHPALRDRRTVAVVSGGNVDPVWFAGAVGATSGTSRGPVPARGR